MMEWIDEKPRLLGQLPPAQLMRSEAVTVEAADQVEKKFSTEEKLLIASLLMSVLSIGWQVFQWRKEREKK